MTTPSPAVLNLTISRESGFQQDLQLRCGAGGSPVQLEGYRFIAQLWSLDRVIRYLDLEVPVIDGGDGSAVLQLRQAVAQGILTDTTDISGGDAAATGDPPELSGGAAPTVFAAEGLRGGRAWMGLLAETTRWDLLQIRPCGKRTVLLRGTATLVD